MWFQGHPLWLLSSLPWGIRGTVGTLPGADEMFNQCPCPIPLFYNNSDPAPTDQASASLPVFIFIFYPQQSLHTVGTRKCALIDASSERAFCLRGLQANAEAGWSVGKEPSASEKGSLRCWFFERRHILDTLEVAWKQMQLHSVLTWGRRGSEGRTLPFNRKRNRWMKVRGGPLRRVPLPALRRAERHFSPSSGTDEGQR